MGFLLMKLPIIVAEGPFCIMFYTSVKTATASLEPIDVSACVFRAWDAEGRPVELLVEEEPHRWFSVGRKSTVLRCDENQPKQTEELRSLLINLLTRIGITGKEAAPLEELIRIAMEHGSVD